MQTPAPVTLTAIPEDVCPQLGKYRLIAEVARDGMGIAYLAVLPGPHGFRKLVVVKELLPALLQNGPCLKMFMDEARLAARLNHPNIVQTIEVGADAKQRFIAMEYLDGQPLQQLVQRALQHWTRMPLRMHLGILLDVLAALEYAHGLADFDGTPLGVVHRDVSPHNVLVTYEGQIKLLDFGISETRAAVGQARASAVQGKMRYMAPEQAAGLRVDRRADLFSVGAMLWEAVVGSRPWGEQSDAAVLHNLIVGAVPRIRDAWPDVDPGLAAVVERAMSVDPGKRYSTASAMREDLERYIGVRNLTPPSARSLGGWVSKLFAGDRDERRVLIDTHLRALGEGTSGQDDRKRLTKTTPSVAVSGVFAQSSFGSATRSSPPDAGRQRAMHVALIAMAAAFGAGIVGVYRFRALDARGASGAASASRVTIAPVDRAPRKAHVIVIASPASAQIYLDDVAVSNPFVADHTPDAAIHHLRIECPGYESATRALAFADDTELEIVLARDPLTLSGRRVLRPAAPTAAANCQPPYVVDSETGKKQWKLECLESEPTFHSADMVGAAARSATVPASKRPNEAGQPPARFSADQL